MTKEKKLLKLFEKRFGEVWKTNPTIDYLINCYYLVSKDEIYDLMEKAGYSAEEIDDKKNENSYSSYLFFKKLYDDFTNSNTFKTLKSTVSKKEVIDSYILYGLRYIEPIDVIDALNDNPANLMNDEDYEEYLKLPDTMTIYRGCSMEEWEDGGECPLGVSWSLDKNTAEFFAYRYGGEDMCVVEAVVSKDCVRYYTNARGEQEVLINGSVENPHIISENVTDYDCEKYHKLVEQECY